MFDKTRRAWIYGLAVAAALTLSACAGAPAAPPTTPAPSAPGSAPATTPAVDDAVCAPAEDGSLTPVTFQLNFTAGGYNAGFALALQEGYYKDAGLNVTIVKGQGSGTTAKLVASGQAGLAFADAVATMQVIAQGAPIKVISTMYQSVPNSVTVLKSSGITELSQLKGKKVADPVGETPSALFPLLLDANGLAESDVERVPMPGTSMVAALMQGQVDAILGSTDGYSLILKDAGADIVDFPFVDNGVVTVSTSIIASDSFLAANSHTVKCFVEASLKGWDTAIKDNKLAIDSLVATFPTDTKPDLNAGQLTAAEALFCGANAKFVGKAEPESWESTVDIAERVLNLPTDLGLKPTDYYTYDYLPAELPTSCPLR